MTTNTPNIGDKRLEWFEWEDNGIGGVDFRGKGNPDREPIAGAALRLMIWDGTDWTEDEATGQEWFEYGADTPFDDAAPYEAAEQRMIRNNNLPANIEITDLP